MVCATIGSLVVGCTTTRVVKRGDEFSLERKAMLVTRNHPGIEISSVRAVGDTLIAFSPHAGHRSMKLHLSEVKKITTRKRAQKQGLYGLLGVAVGGAVGYAAGKDNANDPLATRGASAFVLGAWGGACGLFYGSGLGQKEVFVFQASEPQP
jgi:hypothetical protein